MRWDINRYRKQRKKPLEAVTRWTSFFEQSEFIELGRRIREVITAYRGRIQVTSDEKEMKGDLAGVSKYIYWKLIRMGNSPVMAVCKIISWVLMGMTYEME